jgi:hypothetical protein
VKAPEKEAAKAEAAKDEPKTQADSQEAKDRVALAERQNEIGATLRGGAPDKGAVELDREFQANWQKQQEQAYPELYRKAAQLRGGQPSAQPGAPLAIGGAVALEPGHDPGKFEEYRKQVEGGDAGADTAGSDNVAPHETTGGGTSTPTIVVPDSSVDPR